MKTETPKENEEKKSPEKVSLTSFSHGGGCGCKISPAILDQILRNSEAKEDKHLLVGNKSRDDAAAYDIGGGRALLSTTDFFMPIVDDAFDFGRIASANAISDIYAMGGNPLLAIAILGWPVNKIAPEVAREVLAGARSVCAEAGITLAGGHSIDSPEPIFGLSVNGMIDIPDLKKNNTAKENDLLFLTKPIGTGILATAIKRKIIKEDDYKILVESMCKLNKVGGALGNIKGVHAMTDVTGFGLLGHLIEMAEGSGLCAEINYADIPFFEGLDFYTSQMCFPDNTYRNWSSCESRVAGLADGWFIKLCDPQTSGGLLVAVSPDSVDAFTDVMNKFDLADIIKKPIGRMVSATSGKDNASIIVS